MSGKDPAEPEPADARESRHHQQRCQAGPHRLLRAKVVVNPDDVSCARAGRRTHGLVGRPTDIRHHRPVRGVPRGHRGARSPVGQWPASASASGTSITVSRPAARKAVPSRRVPLVGTVPPRTPIPTTRPGDAARRRARSEESRRSTARAAA